MGEAREWSKRVRTELERREGKNRSRIVIEQQWVDVVSSEAIGHM